MIAWMSFGVDADSIAAAELEAVAAAQAFITALFDNLAGCEAFFEHYSPWSYVASLGV